MVFHFSFFINQNNQDKNVVYLFIICSFILNNLFIHLPFIQINTLIKYQILISNNKMTTQQDNNKMTTSQDNNKMTTSQDNKKMTTSQDKSHSNPSPLLKQLSKNSSAQQLNQQQFHNIDSIVRPMIQHVQSIIQKQFLTLHNKYQLQSYQRKINCYEKYLLPPKPITNNNNINTSKSKKTNKKQSIPQIPLKQQPFIPTSQQVLDYYNCFDEQINLSVQRYQKLYKKSEQNKIKLVNCVQKCSSNSKQQNQLFQTCSTKCKDIYADFTTKLYNNFYNKFLNKQ